MFQLTEEWQNWKSQIVTSNNMAEGAWVANRL